jgi:hypothetical protein
MVKERRQFRIVVGLAGLILLAGTAAAELVQPFTTGWQRCFDEAKGESVAVWCATAVVESYVEGGGSLRMTALGGPETPTRKGTWQVRGRFDDPKSSRARVTFSYVYADQTVEMFGVDVTYTKEEEAYVGEYELPDSHPDTEPNGTEYMTAALSWSPDGRMPGSGQGPGVFRYECAELQALSEVAAFGDSLHSMDEE